MKEQNRLILGFVIVEVRMKADVEEVGFRPPFDRAVILQALQDVAESAF